MLVSPSETGEPQLTFKWIKIGKFDPNFTFFVNTRKPLYDVMPKKTDNSEFFQDVNFELIDSLKYNRSKYLLLFDDSCGEICNSKAFVDIAIARKNGALSTIYIKHNLFHRSNLGRDVELQNSHLVLFKAPRDVMQVSMLSAQLGLGSKLRSKTQ